ncbi:growth hormone-regulated TBC protein 1-A isoform X1 [Uranotaenia lowii]|uniref:growth hormone-regulated TBC protein 1-A isoform X1 n=1 Tax=Uranotaenia lowii TaxID=190385 RepID=UPI0024792A6C|nr:growth hormone-regulated TBC protein 1-A isoform X1 [Uranotaenia lowii]XP_055611703.1 growth hormone-regulated TBC protein 1-A isoform X1 [Uranotaenia lowii]XP_055611704.1 growth hormone-regulated TBC protein 1-A isoform X1 [Uranotaenia lowii]XP_055611705.1 growth hormone-regulated TBC protein 1-A isoform X1 [Uranotaenia lowii]XP_055611706.1 growth hormone-regulated TBC protein 1-A isoform X1 [Uranotaenia lowii]XP_055611707.1 growth hormone-regulated TBC protein 1-A isoform X1 [Uranotaenia 
MAESKFSDVDEYGFRREPDFDYKSYESIMNTYMQVLTTRGMKWQKFNKDGDILKDRGKLKRFVRKGVPLSLRKEVWMKTSGAFQLQQKEPALYQTLLRYEYDQEISDQIKIDLPRTFPDNIHFEQYKLGLYNVLITYAHHNKTVGYCQGLNYIAGLILIVTQNEESTFWLLKVLVEEIVPLYHTKKMENLITDIDVLSELVRVRVPDVHAHIEKLGLPWPVIATKWFICLYAEVVPTETALRIWDCIFLEGNKILLRVGISIVVGLRREILATDDIAPLIGLFRGMEKNTTLMDCHRFMKSIFKIPGSLKRRQIDALRRQLLEQRRSSKRKGS